MRGRNTIIQHYRYRVNPELGKVVCDIFWFPYACPSHVDQPDKYLLPTISPSYKPRYSRVVNCYHNKILEHCNDWIIVAFLDKNTPQVDFYNSHLLIISGMSTNKSKLVKVNGYVAIAVNDEAANIFTLFTLHMSHIHSKKMQNQMEINQNSETLFEM